MARMTPEEIKLKVPTGLFVKDKCDHCDMPIMSSLTYRGEHGDYCGNSCYEAAELDDKQRDRRRNRTVKKKGRARVTENVQKENDTTMIKGSGKDKAATVPSKKKKRSRTTDDDARPRKKKREDEDEDEEETEERPRKKKADGGKSKDKPSAKRKKKKTDNPFSRPSSAVFRAFNLAKEGTTVKAIEKLCEELGVGVNRVFNELRKEEFKESQWSYSEDKRGRIEITDVS